MEKKEAIRYWLQTAERDWDTVGHLFESRDYHWGLFIGHLVLERLFKALYVARLGGIPPRIHDLARLAEKCGLQLAEETLDKLDMISRFNLNVRYPDYQQEIYRICTPEFSHSVRRSMEEIRGWLLQLIHESWT